MLAEDFDAAAFQIVDHHLRVAHRLRTHEVTAVHASFCSLVNLTVDLCEIPAGPRRDERN